MSKIKKFLGNGALVLLSSSCFFLAAEFVIFRFILPAADGHWNVYGHRVAAHAIFRYIRDRRLAPI
ncbi:MAG: hypothetical protein ACREOI_14020 [bacterium]